MTIRDLDSFLHKVSEKIHIPQSSKEWADMEISFQIFANADAETLRFNYNASDICPNRLQVWSDQP